MSLKKILTYGCSDVEHILLWKKNNKIFKSGSDRFSCGLYTLDQSIIPETLGNPRDFFTDLVILGNDLVRLGNDLVRWG